MCPIDDSFFVEQGSLLGCAGNRLTRINRVVNSNEANAVAFDIHRAFFTFEVIEHVAVRNLPFIFHKPNCFGIFFQRLLDQLLHLVFPQRLRLSGGFVNPYQEEQHNQQEG